MLGIHVAWVCFVYKLQAKCKWSLWCCCFSESRQFGKWNLEEAKSVLQAREHMGKEDRGFWQSLMFAESFILPCTQTLLLEVKAVSRLQVWESLVAALDTWERKSWWPCFLVGICEVVLVGSSTSDFLSDVQCGPLATRGRWVCLAEPSSGLHFSSREPSPWFSLSSYVFIRSKFIIFQIFHSQGPIKVWTGLWAASCKRSFAMNQGSQVAHCPFLICPSHAAPEGERYIRLYYLVGWFKLCLYLKTIFKPSALFSSSWFLFCKGLFSQFCALLFLWCWAKENKLKFIIHFKEHTLSFYFLVKTKLCAICRKLKPHFSLNFPKLKFMGNRSNKSSYNLVIYNYLCGLSSFTFKKNVTLKTHQDFTVLGHFTSLLLPRSQDLHHRLQVRLRT